MKAAVKKKWVAALKSGEYKQTRKELRNKDGFCCLGVLCDLYKEETKDGEWSEAEAGQFFVFKVRNGGQCSATVLPGAVAVWAGFEPFTRNPSTKNGQLAELNDAGMTFKKVAAIIEKEL